MLFKKLCKHVLNESKGEVFEQMMRQMLEKIKLLLSRDIYPLFDE